MNQGNQEKLCTLCNTNKPGAVTKMGYWLNTICQVCKDREDYTTAETVRVFARQYGNLASIFTDKKGE